MHVRNFEFWKSELNFGNLNFGILEIPKIWKQFLTALFKPQIKKVTMVSTSISILQQFSPENMFWSHWNGTLFINCFWNMNIDWVTYCMKTDERDLWATRFSENNNFDRPNYSGITSKGETVAFIMMVLSYRGKWMRSCGLSQGPSRTLGANKWDLDNAQRP